MMVQNRLLVVLFVLRVIAINMKTYIVKIQQPLLTNSKTKEVMVYSEDQSIFYMGPITKEVKKFIGNEPKGFYKVSIGKDKMINILEKAGWEDW